MFGPATRRDVEPEASAAGPREGLPLHLARHQHLHGFHPLLGICLGALLGLLPDLRLLLAHPHLELGANPGGRRRDERSDRTGAACQITVSVNTAAAPGPAAPAPGWSDSRRSGTR